MQSLWMLLASFVFAFMGVCVKLASSYYSTAEIVMYRGCIGVVMIGTLALLRGDSLRTRFGAHHLWRGAIGVTALWLWFYAIAQLPLSMAMTLNYMAPIWIAAILFTVGWWRGILRFEWGLLAAILASFVGVTLLLQPSMQAAQWGSGLVAVFSGMLSAFAYIQVRQLGQLGEPEYRVVFYFSLTGMLAGLSGTLLSPGALRQGVIWHHHSGHGVLLLLGIGVAATVAQMAMTRAYRLGKMLVTANLQYTGIVFSSGWGMLLWHDRLGMIGWLGIGVILSSGLVATFYNVRNMTSTAAGDSLAAPPPNAGDPIQTEI